MRIPLLAAVAAALILMIPGQAHAFGCDPNCAGPSISTTTTSVTVAEGSQASVTGDWSNGELGGATMSATQGSVSVGGGLHGGSWTWTYTPADGPADPFDVTISVAGGNDVTIHVTVTGAAPSATGISAPSHATTTSPFGVSITGATDPSAADAADLRYAFDCGSGTFGSFGTSPTSSCSAPGEGFKTIRGEVKDRDGYISAVYSTVVGVFNPVTVTEGQSASKSLTSAGPVCAASSGFLIQNALSWSTMTSDGPQTIPVAINVELPFGGVCSGSFLNVHRTIQFDVVVNNAPPTAMFHAPAVVAASAPIAVSLGAPTDPSAADRAAGYRFSFDCGSGFGAIGTDASASCPGSPSGPRTVKERIYDKDDGFSEYSASVGVDGSPPDSAIGGKPAALDNDATPSFDWTGSDPGGSVAGYAYKLDGGDWSAYSGETSVTLPGLGDGAHTFQVKAKDAAGNEDPTPDSYTWTIDTTPPDAAITSKPTAVSGPAVSFAWQAPGATQFAYKLDDGAWSGWTSAATHDYSGLTDGLHTFAVKARDAAGNEDASPASYGWVVDTRAGETADTQAATQTQTQTQTPTQGSQPQQAASASQNPPATLVCKVPKLKNKKLAAAKKALRAAHCRLGKVKQKRSRGMKPGRVAAQSARAGASLKAGSKVNVVVGR